MGDGHTANGQQAEFFVVLADQADLGPAASFPTKTEKGRFVFQTLQTKAQTTQGSILQLLRDRAIEHRSFYIVNAILVKGTRELAETLAARPEVARIEGNPQIHNDLPQHGPIEKAEPRPRTPATVNQGSTTRTRRRSGRLDSPGRISLWQAPIQVCAGRIMPLSRIIAAGTGRTPITILTGTIRFTTASAILAVTIRRFHAMISFTALTQPGQRSATMARVTRSGWRRGHNGSAAVTWIKAPALRRDTSSAWSFSSHLIPINCTPNEGDPGKAPDITINSWGCPASEGCSANTLEAAVAAQAAAGIQMVVAAGNGGPACSTVSDPPGIYGEAYSIGALTQELIP